MALYWIISHNRIGCNRTISTELRLLGKLRYEINSRYIQTDTVDVATEQLVRNYVF